MAPSQKDIKSDITSSNLTVSESDITTSSATSSAGGSPTIKEDSSNYTSAQPHDSQASGKKSLKDVAKENPTQLGDPVSLKAETSDHEPTDQDRGALGKDGDLAGAPKRDKLQSYGIRRLADIIAVSPVLNMAANTETTNGEKQSKVFVPLENNPAVMNPLAHHLGLRPALSFHDVLSFDEPNLLALIPRPVHALLFLFYITPDSQKQFATENDAAAEYSGSGPNEPVLWYHQTITHACGLIGLLHCVTNGVPKSFIEPDSILSKFIQQATPLAPAERAQLIYDSAELETAHFGAAQQGDSIAPDVHNGEDVNGAFVTFVKSQDGRMWELEGRRKGPVERGMLAEDEDLLSRKAIELGPMAYVRREEEVGGKELRFSCLALAEDWD